MEESLAKIRVQQKESWNKFSAGWKKWDEMVMDFLKPMGEEIIRALNLKGNEVVLDVASGTGQPALTIADKLGNGKVVMMDLAKDMLAIARENAAQKGIKNVETVVCDVCELPFADNTFDAISCRFGFMFFPDMLLATKEMVRVLKPGGKVAVAVWGVPEKNFWVTSIMGAINKNIELAAPPPGSPGMFRCAKDGLITGLFEQAGLKNVSQKEILSKLNCKTIDEFWQMHTDVAAPVVAALGKATDEVIEKIKKDTYTVVNQKCPDGNIMLDSGALIISGEK